MLLKAADFRDPRMLGMAIAVCANPRALIAAQREAQRLEAARQAPPTPPPAIPLRRTMRQMIADLQAKQESERTLMPAQIMTLADALKNAQGALAGLPAVAEKLTRNTGELVDASNQVDAFCGQIAKHTAGVRALLGGMTNGGPPLDGAAPATPAAPVTPTT